MFIVVRNDEGQHALHPAGSQVPAGWQPAGFEGSREDCMAWVDEVWTDLRPLSLQRASGESA